MTFSNTIYTAMGAEFILPIDAINEKLKDIRAFIFDWDGVFNTGQKQASDTSSSFNEIDSMGTNLLRFSQYIQQQQMPISAVISGEKNTSAFYFSQREHFDASYFKVFHKKKALHHFCQTHHISPKQVCFFFDDVLDLDIAEEVGLRILIPRDASVLFTHYVKKNKLADCITAAQSGQFAVREACETLMGIAGVFDAAIKHRTKYSTIYQSYIAQRQTLQTHFFTLQENNIVEVNMP
ncbi:MAG: phosphatase [Bacteroidetes bacterium]|nr:phosphatase [Bacteroidota bacterium]